VPPIISLRADTDWPLVPLVSVPSETTTDVWSSVPGLLQVAISSMQSILLVELTRLLLIYANTITVTRSLMLLVYEVALVIDMFRRWGGDWNAWIRYQVHLGELCSVGTPCLPSTGAVPWYSILVLFFVLSALFVDRVPANE
jgi:hypothetical protein